MLKASDMVLVDYNGDVVGGNMVHPLYSLLLMLTN